MSSVLKFILLDFLPTVFFLTCLWGFHKSSRKRTARATLIARIGDGRRVVPGPRLQKIRRSESDDGLLQWPAPSGNSRMSSTPR